MRLENFFFKYPFRSRMLLHVVLMYQQQTALSNIQVLRPMRTIYTEWVERVAQANQGWL